METRIYETNNDYILDVLEDEEEKLIDKLGEILTKESKYLFYRYMAVRQQIDCIKSIKIM
jgi:hypothetical protein